MPEERRFKRQEFFDLVWSTPMQQLARDFKLSDVGLAKACKRYGIPRPERGYWQKLAVGKAPKRPGLPMAPDGVDEIRFYIPDDPAPQPEPVISPEVTAWIEQEHHPTNKIKVAVSVAAYHPLVRRLKDALESREQNDQHGLRWSGHDTISVSVAKQTIGRACRLLHALVSSFAHHKWRVEVERDQQHHAVVYALGEPVRFSLDERTKRVDHELTPEEERRKWRGELIYPAKWDYHPTGELRLLIEYGFGHKVVFQDRDALPLEDQLNEVVLTMARASIEVLRPARLRREEEEQRRWAEEQKRWQYQQKVERFESAFRAWSAQQERLRFVTVLEETFAKLESAPEAVREYVDWTRRYVAAVDPLPKFFESLAKNATGYHDFSTQRRD